MTSWFGRFILVAAAAVTGCQWEVPDGPLGEDASTDGAQADASVDGAQIDASVDGAQIDASVDGPVDAPIDAIPLVTLNVVRNGAGTGTVTSNTVGGSMIDCGATCTAQFPSGSLVTLTAAPTGGDIFYGWSGGGCSGTGTCMTTVSALTTVTATFDNCVRSTQSCTGGSFTQCNATGDFVSHLIPNGGVGGAPTTITYDGTYACPMGCHASQPRCGDVDASNGLNAALDALETSPAGIDLPSDISMVRSIKAIDTSNFDSGAGMTVVTLDNDSPFSVPAQIVTQSGAPEILVLKVRSFTVPSGTTIAVTGTRALAIVSHFDVHIAGTIDLSGPAGALTGGGPGRTTTAGCVGTYLSLASGGGALFAIGGSSSTGGTGGTGDFNMRIYMTPLGGGCAGGTGGLVSGGPPGGVIQLVSRTRVTLAGSALINVVGGGGYATCVTAGCTSYRATGGGSGGGVSIESPAISVENGTVVAGRGGNGAASNSGIMGMNGSPGTITGSTNAAASTCAGCGTGGIGGTETTLSGSAGAGTAPAIAGGGGGVGRCVTRNRTGSLTPPGGSMKIAHQSFMLPAAR